MSTTFKSSDQDFPTLYLVSCPPAALSNPCCRASVLQPEAVQNWVAECCGTAGGNQVPALWWYVPSRLLLPAPLQESALFKENEADMDRLVAEGLKSGEPLK